MEGTCYVETRYDERSSDLESVLPIGFVHDQKTKSGYGYIYNLNGISYIITCCSLISFPVNSYLAYVIQNEELVSMKLSLLSYLSGLNIAIMKPIDIITGFALELIPLNYNPTIPIECHQKENEIIVWDETDIVRNIRIEDDPIMELEFLLSSAYPKITLYKIRIEVDNYIGAIFCSDGKNIGMIVNMEDDVVYALPLQLINAFVANNISGVYRDLHGINMKYATCEIDDPEYFGIYIRETINLVNYSFCEGDVIIRIDDQEINEYGCIEYNGFEDPLFVPFNTYILLKINYEMEMSLDFTIYRQNEIITDKMYGIDYNDMYKIRFYSKEKFLFLHGSLFIELSEELIELYLKLNYQIDRKFIDGEIEFTNNEYYVIICDLKSLTEALYSNHVESKKMMIVESINGKEIKNIEDVMDQMNSNEILVETNEGIIKIKES